MPAAEVVHPLLRPEARQCWPRWSAAHSHVVTGTDTMSAGCACFICIMVVGSVIKHNTTEAGEQKRQGVVGRKFWWWSPNSCSSASVSSVCTCLNKITLPLWGAFTLDGPSHHVNDIDGCRNITWLFHNQDFSVWFSTIVNDKIMMLNFQKWEGEPLVASGPGTVTICHWVLLELSLYTWTVLLTFPLTGVPYTPDKSNAWHLEVVLQVCRLLFVPIYKPHRKTYLLLNPGQQIEKIKHSVWHVWKALPSSICSQRSLSSFFSFHRLEKLIPIGSMTCPRPFQDLGALAFKGLIPTARLLVRNPRKHQIKNILNLFLL